MSIDIVWNWSSIPVRDWLVVSFKGTFDCHNLIISSAQSIEVKIFCYTMKETIAEYVDIENVKHMT